MTDTPVTVTQDEASQYAPGPWRTRPVEMLPEGIKQFVRRKADEATPAP